MIDFSVFRVTKIDTDTIEQINKLLDVGTMWEATEGNRFLGSADNILLLAKSESKIVGFLIGYRLQRIDKRRAEVLLYEIGVDENFRKLGIGKALVAGLKEWAKGVDADEVWVLTNKSNAAAVGLYECAGGITEAADEQMYVFKC